MPVKDLVATFANAWQGGFGGLRIWTGEVPRVANEQRPCAIAARAGYSVTPSCDRLVELTAAQAAAALTFYSSGSMGASLDSPRDELTEVFRRAIKSMGPGAHFYSNSSWVEGRRASGWFPLSGATFDGGVIGFDEHDAFIVWVEEED